MTAPCKYTAIERDVYMTHITRIVHGVTSTFHCELECNRESDFNCRSYTYVENGSLGPPQCLLSADNRQAVSPGILEYRSRSLYAEKDCRESSVTTLSSDNYNGKLLQRRLTEWHTNSVCMNCEAFLWKSTFFVIFGRYLYIIYLYKI